MGDVEKTLTDPVVTAANPIIDSGILIPNFNDAYIGRGPDLGAFEAGGPAWRYGRQQTNRSARAPWELYY